MDLILSSFISDESEQVIPCRAEQSITNYKNAEISMNFSKVQAANVIVARKRELKNNQLQVLFEILADLSIVIQNAIPN
ncbi:uncharacterized protein LOC118512467 isoform X3 [Anopheles stephensi]|uniref:uncharacterized protein LOC118512467 isoform X3 n=1 Tax=Anopheles stephensi TaxID=30069 RepID=UPI001658BFED|nr:uncharacterized protein LOC118512467 isoform X3 [Anopheles stephensi]